MGWIGFRILRGLVPRKGFLWGCYLRFGVVGLVQEGASVGVFWALIGLGRVIYDLSCFVRAAT